MQTTIKSAISFAGRGLHSGRPARLTIRPASAEHGIWFVRTDVELGDRAAISYAPSATAFVDSPARSEPAPGSE